MKRIARNLLLTVVVVLLVQGCTTAAKTNFISEPLPKDHFVAKVDQWVIIQDASTSMGQRYHRERKLQIENNLLASMNTAIPEVGFKGALVVFGHGPGMPKGKLNVMYGPETYSTDGFAKAEEAVQLGGSNSPLDGAIDLAAKQLEKGTSAAIVILSDGLNMGKAETQAAAALKKQLGNKVTIYAVQIGDSAAGRALLDSVVAAGGQGYVVNASQLTSWAGMSKFVEDVFLWPDADGDGVADHLDKCPDTPKGVAVDANGCPPDTDGDGVPDYLDKCPGTPAGVKVDAKGCPIDSDGDGVPDAMDKCPNTPAGVKVDANGCPIDSDGDGVPDYLDKCPDTPKGVPVNPDGCPPPMILVHADGTWEVKAKVFFDVNKYAIKDDAKALLDRVAESMKDPHYSAWSVEIQGHCDKSGPKAFNDRLSLKRAEAVRDYLAAKGVPTDRMVVKGYGWSMPRYPNDTKENRAKNRRVEFKPFKK
ncbi:MAG: OmpA family protein [Acidobacteria bacterium]|nr:OmpA family protein [Acidobacteriota bacterium]